jgi:hypothetical protein
MVSKKNNNIKNAIGMIIFTNPLYLVGACLSAWTHRTIYYINII